MVSDGCNKQYTGLMSCLLALFGLPRMGSIFGGFGPHGDLPAAPCQEFAKPRCLGQQGKSPGLCVHHAGQKLRRVSNSEGGGRC